MSNRAQRRAAERSNRTTAKTSADTPPAAQTISDAQLNANRANAQCSTGPTSAAGKAASSLNAVKTGLTGRTILLPSDDAVIYQQHIDRIYSQFAPATDQESTLVQTIADTDWRLLRIAPLESGIWAMGQLELANLYPDERNPAVRQSLIQAEVFRAYRKELTNIALQERRLRNQRKADVAELQALQQVRIEKAASETKKNAAAPKPAANGFVFSAEQTTPVSPSPSPCEAASCAAA
jgi:hypothetical protein